MNQLFDLAWQNLTVFSPFGCFRSD